MKYSPSVRPSKRVSLALIPMRGEGCVIPLISCMNKSRSKNTKRYAFDPRLV